MSKPCEFEFVPRKRAVKDSGVQFRNHNSKSGVVFQGETALNAGEAENHSMENWKQYIKGTTKMHGTFGYQNKFKTKTSVSGWKRIAQILEGCQSLLQYCNVVQNCKTGVLQRPWIPHATTR